MEMCKKKGTLRIQKSQIAILVLNQSPISAVFPIVRFAGDPKTALTGDLLYYIAQLPLLPMRKWQYDRKENDQLAVTLIISFFSP